MGDASTALFAIEHSKADGPYVAWKLITVTDLYIQAVFYEVIALRRNEQRIRCTPGGLRTMSVAATTALLDGVFPVYSRPMTEL